MDLSNFLPLLQSFSPWLAAALLALSMLLHHFRKSREQTQAQQALDACLEVRSMLTLHDSQATLKTENHDKACARQTSILEKIAQELVNLNAAQPGRVVSNENAKLIIRYQWNWCRDETARLIANSVVNNHFSGNEALVSRRLLKAWKQAAKESSDSVDRIEGMRYPHKPLFERHIVPLWKLIWEWALPLYHRDCQNLSLAVEDLQDRVRTLFDDAIRLYFIEVEDIDHGALYSRPSSSTATPVTGSRSEPGVKINEEEWTFANSMGEQLKSYKAGLGSGNYDSVAVRQVLACSMQARRQERDDEEEFPTTSIEREVQ